MRKLLLVALVAGLLAAPLWGAEPTLNGAMALYQKNRYEEAARELQALLAAGKETAPARLSLGLVYLQEAHLYRTLHRKSLPLNRDYLTRLTSVRQGRSRLADLYLGETLLALGETAKAAASFEKIAGDPKVIEKYRQLARVNLGLCRARQGRGAEAKEIWGRVKRGEPEVLGALAAVYSRTGLGGEDPLSLCRKALDHPREVPIGVLTAALDVYARAGETEKGLGLLPGAKLQEAAAVETFGVHKALRFYQPALLDHLGDLYARGSVALLRQAADDPATAGVARYYLGEALALQGGWQEAGAAFERFLAMPAAPKALVEKAKVRQAALGLQTGKKGAAWTALNQLAQGGSPVLLAEILLAAAEAGEALPEIAARAAVVAEAAEGKRHTELKYALGRYHLARGEDAKALLFLDAARDKSNKNRIEHNAPLLLIELADASVRNLQYSEALEIYFALSGEFPAVRQLQEALQGIYAMEQKSAGDVKIF